MQLNKEEFLKTKLGSNLVECITEWDTALIACDKLLYVALRGTGERERVQKKTRGGRGGNLLPIEVGSVPDGDRTVLRHRVPFYQDGRLFWRLYR